MDRLPPHNEEAELGVLGSCMLDPTLVPKVLTLPTVAFYDMRHQAIFDAFRWMNDHDVPLDLISLSDTLRRAEKLDQVGGLVFLSGLPDSTPSAANIDYWMEIVRTKWLARQTIRTCTAAVARVYDDDWETQTALDSAMTELKNLSLFGAKNGKSRTLANLLPDVMDKRERASTDPESLYGLRTGLPKLDHLTLGMHPGQMWVVGARPSVGKSALGATISRNVAGAGHGVAFFSLEMAAEDIADRLLAIDSELPLNRAGYSESEKILLRDAHIRLKKLPFTVFDYIRDVSDITLEAGRLVRENGIKLVVVDYLGLMTLRNSDEGHYTRIGLCSNALKSFALEHKVVVLALAQLSRASAKEDRRPNLSDLRSSGEIEQDADVVILLHRTEAPTAETFQTPIQACIEKSRKGPVGGVNLVFRNQITKFEEASNLHLEGPPHKPEPLAHKKETTDGQSNW